jgi:O-antigen/teichoic acid export membrane protein
MFAERRRGRAAEGSFPWREALAMMGLNASGLFLIQLDRLIIPYVLPLEELATYGVLAAIVGSLFRVLQMGVGFSLTPRLAAAPGVRERRRLIRHEARLVAIIVAVGSAGIWVLTPLIERVFLAGKYHLTGAVILAGIGAGVAKSLNAFSNATVTALADQRELTLVNIFGWVSVAISIAAAAVLSRWGLAGVVWGVGLGWLLRAATGIGITLRHLHLPPHTPSSAPADL